MGKICDMDCFNCPYPDCINDKVGKRYDSQSWRNRPEEYKAWYRQYQRDRSARLKAEGLCTSCGKRPLYTKTRCHECQIKYRRLSRERYRAMAAQTVSKTERREQEGKCIWCEEPRLLGRKLCQAHYDAMLERSRKGGEMTKRRHKTT